MPAHATLADADVQSLNPRLQKYGSCPTDSPCYILETRIIRAKVADPSEASGDENYILPIWAIVDGMGVNPHPHVLRTGSDDIFRVNIAKRTIGGDRGSNMGTMFWQRETSSWADLQSRDPNAYKLHLNKDFVIPISRERWSSEGLIFSTTMMEHDNSQGRDIDRAYLQMARKVQSGLLQGATQARAQLNNPTYYGNAMKATEKFVKDAARLPRRLTPHTKQAALPLPQEPLTLTPSQISLKTSGKALQSWIKTTSANRFRCTSPLHHFSLASRRNNKSAAKRIPQLATPAGSASKSESN